MRLSFWFVVVVVVGRMALLPGKPAQAQQGAASDFAQLRALDDQFQKAALELDRKKLQALAALAETTKGDESEAAYSAAFNLAVARNFYEEAEQAARAYLRRPGIGNPHAQALAVSITLVNRASHGEHEASLKELKTYLAERAAARLPDDKRLPAPLVYSLAEAYLQRLFQGSRYDIAKKLCDLLEAELPDPEIKSYFHRRGERIGMIGNNAPRLEGKDADGKLVRLSDLRGKVVLVDFWATWCPPSVAEFPLLHQLADVHKKEGFVILGVDMDESAAVEGEGADRESHDATAMKKVRAFLIANHAWWPNIVGKDAEAAATAYGVEEIPARFLVGRDGKIVHLEQRDEALAQSIKQALAQPAPGR